ncbi:MAG TPA: autotransporter outer membrane beta-barrel domain-containing protein [Anaeromyxobacter sp.]
MLATVAALQLLVLSQVSGPPKLVTPDETPPPADGAQPSTPPDGASASGATPAAEAPPAPALPLPSRRSAAPLERPRQASLLGAEPLRGASAALAWAGWSSLGAAYAIGFSPQDDVGVFLDYDWAKTESHIGVLYRRPLAKAGPFDMAGRLAASWYTNFGAGYVYSDNHSDRGLELTPALVLSQRAAGGLFSAAAEAAMTVTMKYSSGFLFSPRLSFAYEAPLYPQVTIGARIGVGYRAGAGDAPLREGRGELQFLVVAGYQLL